MKKTIMTILMGVLLCSMTFALNKRYDSSHYVYEDGREVWVKVHNNPKDKSDYVLRHLLKGESQRYEHEIESAASHSENNKIVVSEKK